MKKVTKIDKIQNVTSQKQKLRVAAYCRVSTSNDAQLESLETQKWIQYSAMNSYSVSQNCRISLKTNLQTLQCLMRRL